MCPGGAGTRDVVLGVPHDDAARCRNPVGGPHAADGEPGEVVAIRGFLTEGAECESILDPEPAQLDLRHARHVAGQQPLYPSRLGLDGVEQLRDARQQPPASGMEQHPHVIEHRRPELRLVIVREPAAVLVQDVAQNQRLGAPGERDVAQIVRDAQMLRHRRRECLARGAVGEQQRAVHIEQPRQTRTRSRDAVGGSGGHRESPSRETGYDEPRTPEGGSSC